jgi:P2 family phage contractile tail tube protein
MSSSNPIPEKLINYTVFLEGNRLVGTADVELPKLKAMTDTVSGAGIAGEVESPVIGHYESMTTSITFRTINGDVGTLATPAAHLIDFRGSQQVCDAGTYKTVAVRVTMKAIPKTVDLGKFKVGAVTETSDEFEVIYLKLYVDGKEVIEIDKLNYIAKFDGVDVLAGVRADLGI